MDDVRRELAALRRRMRLQAVLGIGFLVAAIFAMGGADVVATTGVHLFVESDAYKVKSQDASSAMQERLVVTGGVNTARVKILNGNIVLASQSADPGITDAGTLWYDSTAGILKFRDASGWISTKTPTLSATSRVLGRKSSGGGDAEECTLSDVLDFVGSAAQGDLLYRSSSGWTRLAAGTSGQFLKTQGSGANPTWGTPSSSHVLNVQAGLVGTVGSGEDTLYTYDLPANTLDANNKGVRITAKGEFANTTSNTTLKLYFGTASTTVTLPKTVSAASWEAEWIVIRTAVNTQIAYWRVHYTSAASDAVKRYATATLPTQDDGAAITVKVTGEGTSNNDITADFLFVEKLAQ